MSSYYYTCPRCGANLDPGEPCGCRDTETEEISKEIKEEKKDGCNDQN